MDEKPEWVNDWAWGQYLIFVRRWTGLGPGGMTPSKSNMLESARRVMFSESCASIWKGLAKRKTYDPYIGEDYPPVYALLVNIGMALRGPSELENIPKSQRKSGGEKMIGLIRSLRKEFSSIVSHDELPEAFVHPAEVKADAVVKAFYSSGFEEAFSSMKKGPDQRSFDEKLVKEGAFFSILMALNALDAWEEGAIAWSESSPAIYRPNSEGANRAYFVRRVTDYFFSAYRTPFREHTLALCCVFFDCATLDASSIAKLAPCAETSK